MVPNPSRWLSSFDQKKKFSDDDDDDIVDYVKPTETKVQEAEALEEISSQPASTNTSEAIPIQDKQEEEEALSLFKEIEGWQQDEDDNH